MSEDNVDGTPCELFIDGYCEDLGPHEKGCVGMESCKRFTGEHERGKIKELELQLGLLKIALEQKSELLGSCEKALNERDQSISLLERKANLWDAFISNQRIRILGWAKLGEQGYQHMGFEIWTQYGTVDDRKDPDYCKRIADEKENSINNLEIYLDAWMKTPPPKQP